MVATSLFGLVAAAACGFAALWAAGHLTGEQQLRVRGLFAGQAIVPERMETLCKDNSGVAISLTGAIDSIGNPEDDWLAVANSYFGAESLGSGVLVAAWAASALAIVLSLTLLVSGSLLLFIGPRAPPSDSIP